MSAFTNTELVFKNKLPKHIVAKKFWHELEQLPFLADDVLSKMPKSILVAFSGGLDSVVLATLLAQYTKNHNSVVVVLAHLNHGLRESSSIDVSFAKKYAKTLGLPIICGELSEADFVRAGVDRLGLEATARNLRYSWLRQQVAKIKQNSADPVDIRIATAHHANDQAESLMLHLGRGSGLNGLTGMRLEEGDLLRPLLKFLRSELSELAEVWHLPFVEDETNNSDEFLRNRIRHSVLPCWATALEYSPVSVLARTCESLQEDNDALDSMAETQLVAVKIGNELSAAGLRLMLFALRHRVITLHVMQQSGGSSIQMRRDQLKTIDKLLENQKEGKVSISQNLVIEVTPVSLRLIINSQKV